MSSHKQWSSPMSATYENQALKPIWNPRNPVLVHQYGGNGIEGTKIREKKAHTAFMIDILPGYEVIKFRFGM